MHGVHRSDIEVLQQYGIASVPPAGAVMVVLAVGGDQGDSSACPSPRPDPGWANSRPARAVLYGAAGQRVHMKSDGSIDVQSGVKVTAKAPIFDLEADGVTMKARRGPASPSRAATVTHNGKNIGDTHVHGGVVPGVANHRRAGLRARLFTELLRISHFPNADR